jgi:hypothetical protein
MVCAQESVHKTEHYVSYGLSIYWLMSLMRRASNLRSFRVIEHVAVGYSFVTQKSLVTAECSDESTVGLQSTSDGCTGAQRVLKVGLCLVLGAQLMQLVFRFEVMRGLPELLRPVATAARCGPHQLDGNTDVG